MKISDIPQDVNLYDIYKESAKENRENGDSRLCLQAVHEAFKRFKVNKKDRRKIGNILLRFSHFMGEQDEVVQMDENDPTMRFIADLYEFYKKRVTQLLKASDEKRARKDRGGTGPRLRIHR